MGLMNVLTIIYDPKKFYPRKAEIMSDEEQKEQGSQPRWHARRQAESKVSRWWRPAMGWMYMTVCIFDFIIFPAAWSWHLASVGQTVTQWQPLTLQATGFFHVAMGVVLGISAWNRTVEKLNDKI